jgi:hypothetical protein
VTAAINQALRAAAQPKLATAVERLCQSAASPAHHVCDGCALDHGTSRSERVFVGERYAYDDDPLNRAYDLVIDVAPTTKRPYLKVWGEYEDEIITLPAPVYSRDYVRWKMREELNTASVSPVAVELAQALSDLMEELARADLGDEQ